MAELEKKTQFVRALSGLRSMVLNGHYAPGARLSEVTLSRELGISRTPVREAIVRLVEDGLVERLQTGGYQVLSFSYDDANDAIEMRGVIEGTAVRLAAERGADPEAMARAGAMLDRIDAALAPGPEAMDVEAYAALNHDFHLLLGELTDSQTVRREVARICRLPLAGPSTFLLGQTDRLGVRQSLAGAQAQHRAILDAVHKREGARAEALAREHARIARQNLDHILFEDRSLARHVPGLGLVANL